MRLAVNLGSMSDVDVVTFDEYRETVTDRLVADRGFAKLTNGPENYEAIAFHRRDPSLRPPGLLDVVPVVAGFASPATRTLREFSTRGFEFATSHDATVGRTLGGVTAAIPVAACENPGHHRAYEFPVVVDLSRETVHYFSDTPLFGGGAYETFRKLAAAALDPSVADPELELDH
jgi:hypothetical protein